MGGGVDGGQDPECGVVAIPAGGVEDVAQLADSGLEQHRGQVLVLLDVVAGLDGRRFPVVDEFDSRHREHVAGHHPCGDGPGDVRGVFALQVDVHEVRLAEGGGRHTVGRTDQQTVVANVGSVGQAVTDVGEIGGDARVVLQTAGGLGHQQRHDDGRDDDHADTHDHQALSARASAADVKDLGHQPPNLAPESRLNIAMVSSMFTITTTTIAARIAWPAATPTPSGPPLA